MIDHYQTLGVAYDDPQGRIRSQYRLLTLSSHPDVVDSPQIDNFIKYAQAYRVLGHQARRQRYNAELGIFVKSRPLHPGHHLYQHIEVSPELAEQGGIVSLTFLRYEPCSLCWLTGCQRCEGLGMIPEQVSVQVKLLPHTQPNAAIFIESQGGCSEPGGTRGDLFVYVIIR